MRTKLLKTFNHIQDEGQKDPSPPTTFFSVTFTNVGITSEIFLFLSFNPFATPVKHSFRPDLVKLNQEHPSKKMGFSGQILIKMRL